MEQSSDKELAGCYPGKFSKSSFSSHSDVSLDAKEDKRDRKVFKPKKDQGYSHLEKASSEEELVDGQLRSKPKKPGKVFTKLKPKNKTFASFDEKSALQSKSSKHHNAKQGVKSKSTYDSNNQTFVENNRPIFGSSLKDALRNNPSHDGVQVPAIVRMCIDCVNESESKTVEDCQERIKYLAAHLPSPNRTLLAYLFLHMRQVADNADHNKMPLANIGSMLQSVLNFSQPLLNFFLQYPAIIFPDIKPKPYIPPITTNSSRLAMEFPNTVKDIEEELKKQESLLNFIHEDIKLCRGDSRKEEQLWDVQRLITQLKREMKKLKKHYQNSPLPFSDHGTNDKSQTDKALCLEMFEEKQLLAIQMELLEAIEAEEKMILSLSDKLRLLKTDPTLIDPRSMCTEKDPDDDLPEDEWLRLCEIEEQRKEQLLTQLIEERNLCARLRAQIEMSQLEKQENCEATSL